MSPLAVSLFLSAATLAAEPPPDPHHGAEVPLIESFLREGRIDAGIAAAERRLAEVPDDSEARYGLGVLRILGAVERLTRSLHRHGLRSSTGTFPFVTLPIVRLPVPENPDPEPITDEQFRAILARFDADLTAAADTLAKVEDPGVKLRLPVGRVRLDLDGDGDAGEDETFWKIFTAVAWRAAKLDEGQKDFPIAFDAADVHWMIGYTHLLRALLQVYLAHDTAAVFGTLAPALFTGVEVPESPLENVGDDSRGWRFGIADLILAIHRTRLEVTEPDRMRAAREHLLAMISQSRRCWEHALAETDDDREWIPNAGQTSLTPLTVTPERIAGWRRFLGEAERVLNGEVLLPHWRAKNGFGLDLKRVFEQPRTFDLVEWVHGVGAVPYLERGEVVTRDTARQLTAAFEGRFLAFAVWFQ